MKRREKSTCGRTQPLFLDEERLEPVLPHESYTYSSVEVVASSSGVVVVRFGHRATGPSPSALRSVVETVLGH
jgi:hypothetical protein